MSVDLTGPHGDFEQGSGGKGGDAGVSIHGAGRRKEGGDGMSVVSAVHGSGIGSEGIIIYSLLRLAWPGKRGGTR